MSDGAWTDAHEYRIRATVELPTRESDPGSTGPVSVLFTDWNCNLDMVARQAEDLNDEYGFSTQVERRQRAETVDYEQYATGGSEGDR